MRAVNRVGVEHAAGLECAILQCIGMYRTMKAVNQSTILQQKSAIQMLVSLVNYGL